MNAMMYGWKLGMTRIFNEQGESYPVTVLELPPNVVHQVKKAATEGYAAVQIGIGSQKPQRVNRPMTAHVAKAKKGMPQHLREIRFDRVGRESEEEYSVGDEIGLGERFEVGIRVDVTGVSLGKGFAGVVKRHGMKGAQTMTHGTHEKFRHAGSIGCRKFPGRVFKNKRMAGHMGAQQVTQSGLEVVSIRPEDNLLLVRGSVPGPKKSVVFVQTSVKQ